MLIASVMAAAMASCPVAQDRAAEAQRPAPPKGVSGEIVTVAEDRVDLRQKDGALITVPMSKGWTLSYLEKATPAALQVGQFIGSANMALGEAHGKANELRVFEAGYMPEFGTHVLTAPNAAEGTRMTHGFVFGLEKTGATVRLQVAYPAGCRVLDVASDLPVMVSVAVDRALARQGVVVAAVMRPDQNGVIRAGRLTLPAKP